MNQLKKKFETMTWAKMSDLTGLHRNTIQNIARYNHIQILGMNVGTLIILKEKLGVDMLSDFKEYHLSIGSATDK